MNMGKAFFSAAVVLLCAACSSQPKVTRVDSQEDLSGYWNTNDVKIVCDSLIRSCLDSPRVTAAIAQKGRVPRVLVGTFRNESDEHIDTSIISSIMEITLDNSGRLQFVAGGDVREEIRTERQDQQVNASEATAATLANESAADFLLTGSVKSNIDRAGNRTSRTYLVRAELTNIETGERLWSDQNMEINKTVVTPRSKL